ncbi:MAG: hypothetical protein QG659_282 [Patescibacteria group bacterium]|nr:hypothetical protein [Patescibacteria group bacterium]
MSVKKQEIVSVADVADGNPSTAWSLARQLHLQDGDATEILLTTTSIPVNYFHRDISADHHEARYYTEHSEAKRLGAKSRLYAAACFGEFALRLSTHQGHDIDIPSRWTIVQEHQLLGAPDILIDSLGITDIRVVVPDVFPKESAKHAVRNTVGATFSVWNLEAQYELENEGFKVELHKPYHLDGFRPQTPEFYSSGADVVVKSSGNGMPREWENELKSALARSRSATWGFHTPRGKTSHNFEVMRRLAKPERVQNFYNDLGGNTKILIGYPSELVGVVCDMRERGVPIWMIALPPRGAHELRNLKFAIENNLVLGEFMPREYSHPPTFPGLEQITSGQIAGILQNLPKAKWVEGIIGTTPIWSDIA